MTEKMKTKIFKPLAFGLCCCLALSLASCGEDFLDKTPESDYVASTYYNTDAAVIKAIEPLYNRAWHEFNSRSLMAMGSIRANDAWNPYVSSEFARFQLTGLDELLCHVFIQIKELFADQVALFIQKDRQQIPPCRDSQHHADRGVHGQENHHAHRTPASPAGHAENGRADPGVKSDHEKDAGD